MDLGYLEFTGQFRKKDFWQLKLWTAKSLSISKAIIAISASTKRDIVRHYSTPSEKISVTHLAYDKAKFHPNIGASAVSRVKNKYSIVGDYVLFLSTLKPSKNVTGLLEAFSGLNGVSLVIAGKKGWLYESIFKKVGELGLKERVVFTGYIPEEDKAPLIKGASVFALPSFWEGFGFDPLYALALGTPVVVSNKGSLPEVVGDAGRLVDPSDTKGITLALKEVLSMSKTDYNSTISKGYEQADKFSWEKTAKDTVKVLEKAKKAKKAKKGKRI